MRHPLGVLHGAFKAFGTSDAMAEAFSSRKGHALRETHLRQSCQANFRVRAAAVKVRAVFATHRSLSVMLPTVRIDRLRRGN